MNRFLSSFVLVASAVILPAAAQTPAPKPAAPAAPKPAAPAAPAPATPPSASTAPSTAPAPGAATPAAAPVPLPAWFREIDTANKGEVTRAEFLKYRMKTFDQLDSKKAGKLTVDEFLKVAEPPFSTDGPNTPPLAERQARARAEFDNLDTNRDGMIERAEAEALVHAEFNQYDTDRDNKVTEPELRLIVQRSMQREQAERQQAEARRRQGMMAINDWLDLQLRSADQLDKNNDGKISQAEYAAVAGAADGPQVQGAAPYELRRKLAMYEFGLIDTNKDGQLDKVELTAHAVNQFMEIDTNKDRFLTQEEFNKFREAELVKMRAIAQTLMPAQPAQSAQPRPAPAQPRPAQPGQPPQQQQPSGLAPGLPQGTR